MIKRLLHDDAETLAMFEREIVGKHGTNQHTKREDGSNPTVLIKDRGKAYTLRRLAKDRPELFERVKAGELTANAAAIEAGFRKVATPLDELRKLWKKASDAERATFLERLGSSPGGEIRRAV